MVLNRCYYRSWNKIDKEYSVYKEALEKIIFAKELMGLMKRKSLGECNFQTIPIQQYENGGQDYSLILILGKGVWNDMNEPAVMEVPNKTFPGCTP
jgi:alpha-glucosidase